MKLIHSKYKIKGTNFDISRKDRARLSPFSPWEYSGSTTADKDNRNSNFYSVAYNVHIDDW